MLNNPKNFKEEKIFVNNSERIRKKNNYLATCSQIWYICYKKKGKRKGC